LNDQDAKQNTRVELKLQAKPQGQTLDLAIRISQQGLRKQKPHTVVQWFVCLIVHGNVFNCSLLLFHHLQKRSVGRQPRLTHLLAFWPTMSREAPCHANWKLRH
jgi:hypothetical protein